MAQRVLRPLDYGGLLDEAIDLYKRKFLLFIGIYGIIAAPMTLVNALQYGDQSGYGRDPILELLSLAFFLLALIAHAAVIHAASETYLGRDATVAASYRAVLRLLPAYIGTTLLAWLLISVGLALCIAPGLYLLVRFAFVGTVLVLERKSWSAAMRRSKQLAASSADRIIVLYVLLVVLSGAIYLISMLAAGAIVAGVHGTNVSERTLTMTVSGLGELLLSPLQWIAFVLLYYDIRVRKEGFDVEVVAMGMGSTPAPAPE